MNPQLNAADPYHPFRRLEDKVDKLADAMAGLLVYIERQTVQAAAITTLTARQLATEQKVDMWVNRGMGMWAMVLLAFALYKTFPAP